MKGAGRIQAYKNFRLVYFRRWRFVFLDYGTTCFLFSITSRLFWYNFETVRRVVKRAVQQKLQKRYKIKQQQKLKYRKGSSVYSITLKQPVKIFWVGSVVYLPWTRKAKGSRMGHGKGSFKAWQFRMVAGRVFFKIYSTRSILTQTISQKVCNCTKVRPQYRIVESGGWYW